MSKNPNNNIEPIDLIAAFNAEKVDFSPIQQARNKRLAVSKGLEPYMGEFGPEQKRHLLKRTMMGYAHRHYLDIQDLSLKDSLDLIFSQQEFPENPINDYFYEISREEVEKQNHKYVEPYKDYTKVGEPNGSPWPRHQSFEAWMMKHMVNQPTSIHWRMVFFLHNILVCGKGSVKMQFQHYRTLFTKAFSPYKEILHAITLDPMMLDYLNLQSSNKYQPDENYARELQELFTVGKGPGSKYTESDVVEMAKLLVGWRFSYDSKNNEGEIHTLFQVNNHDTSDKHFSEFYGNRIIRGRLGEEGKEELDELLDMILETDEAAKYLSRRLYQFYCFPEISEEAEENIILPMAEIMRENNFELAAPLKALLGSEHFFDTSFYSAMIKSPFDYVMNLKKSFQYKMINYNNKADIPKKLLDEKTIDFYQYRGVVWATSDQGQNFFDPPSVSGWPAYYQAPVYDYYWINSQTIARRASHGNGFSDWGDWLANGTNSGNVHLRIDPVAYILTLNNPENLDSFIQESIERFSGIELPQYSYNRIKNSMIQGANERHFSDLITKIKKGGTENEINELSDRIKKLFKAFFQMGESQLF